MASILGTIVLWMLILGILFGVPFFLIRVGSASKRKEHNRELTRMNQIRQQRFLKRELPLQEKIRQDKMCNLSASVEKE